MNFNELFKIRFEEILKTYHGKKAVLFFRGFGIKQLKFILSCSDRLLSNKDILTPEGTLNLQALHESKKTMIQQMMFSDRQLIVGIYEQLIALSETVTNLRDMYDGEIVVVENNLFSRYYPCCIPTQAAQRLYEFFQRDEKETDEKLNVFSSYYGDVMSLTPQSYFVSFIDKHTDEKYSEVPFFQPSKNTTEKKLPNSKLIQISDWQFPLHLDEILNDKLPEKTTYVVDTINAKRYASFQVLTGILDKLGIPFGIKRSQKVEKNHTDSGETYLPILKKHWGPNAQFRMLKFYTEPEISNEITEISQGAIISNIIKQSETCLSGSHSYKNIFITAPTGSGKSILFQIPAIYLAEKYNAVTIVVTPLIALMKDQVTELEREHDVSNATFLNSTISFEEREKRINQIKDGTKSIVYLAPELLIAAQLENITGNRPVGLFVIDEVHLVTSWGKDFRSDYWYLGDYLKKLNRNGVWFPVLCLTATAVYGGMEDVVNETIQSLSLDNPLLYLGNVRRENIRFQIRKLDKTEISGGIEEFKLKHASAAIQDFVSKREKTLVYCPFASQVTDIYNEVDPSVRTRVRMYYGSLDKLTRDMAQNSFSTEDCDVMICTKAFGMGVNIKNIKNVYHYAPTGSLADYVQEIGRAARNESIEGYAITEFLPSDMRYIRTLYGISEMKQYQLREMIRKLYGLYREKKHRNLLVSPDAFSYLFQEKNLDAKVKNGLLLIAKDLSETYGFPVINVRPKTMFTKNYVNVPESAENEFDRLYGRYARILEDNTRRIIPSINKKYESDTIVRNSGNIYEINMSKLWENNFSDITFMQFKRLFFQGELFNCGEGQKLSPRLHISIHYKYTFSETKEKLKRYLTCISNVFRKYKTQSKTFCADDFKKDLIENLGNGFSRFEFSDMLLEMFVADISQNIYFNYSRNRLKFIAARKAASGEGSVYRVMNSNYITLSNSFLQLLGQCIPNKDGIYRAFIPVDSTSAHLSRMHLISVLELFGLGTCDVTGGKNMEIFVRINDPVKLKRLSIDKYNNKLLTEIRRRHKSAQNIMMRFLQKPLSSEQRWDLIENYFLGREDYVEKILCE